MNGSKSFVCVAMVKDWTCGSNSNILASDQHLFKMFINNIFVVIIITANFSGD